MKKLIFQIFFVVALFSVVGLVGCGKFFGSGDKVQIEQDIRKHIADSLANAQKTQPTQTITKPPQDSAVKPPSQNPPVTGNNNNSGNNNPTSPSGEKFIPTAIYGNQRCLPNQGYNIEGATRNTTASKVGDFGFQKVGNKVHCYWLTQLEVDAAKRAGLTDYILKGVVNTVNDYETFIEVKKDGIYSYFEIDEALSFCKYSFTAAFFTPDPNGIYGITNFWLVHLIRGQDHVPYDKYPLYTYSWFDADCKRPDAMVFVQAGGKK